MLAINKDIFFIPEASSHVVEISVLSFFFFLVEHL